MNMPMRMPSARWARVRLAVFRRDGYRCRECGLAGRLECDHVIPLQRGGSDDIGNMQALCRACHIEKTRREQSRPQPRGHDEWRARVAALRKESAARTVR